MRLDEKFEAWYDRQSFGVLFIIGVSPMLVIAAVLILIALIF